MQSGHQGILTAIVLLAAVAIFLVRNLRTRRVTVARFWVVPVVLAVLTGVTFEGTLRQDTSTTTLIAIFAGVIAAIPFGFARGHASRVRLGERPGTLYLDPSPLLVAIWLFAFVAKFVMRLYLPGTSINGSAATDAFIVFATTTVIVSRIMIFRKYEALRRAGSTGS